MSGDANLTLYSDAFWISPYVHSVFVTLREKEIAFAVKTVALHEGEQRKPPYRDQAVTGRVPALDHRGFWLSESSAIVEYLEDTFPAPHFPRALPADPRERARARQVMAWLRSDLLPLREEYPTSTMFYERAGRPLTEAGEGAARKLLQAAELLVPEGRASLFSAWSTADADLAFMLHRLILNEYPVQGKVRAFAEAQWARPSVRAFVEQARAPYVPY
jgi:glutathione S-transferase